MKQFKCMNCPHSGHVHARCDHYHEVKAERAKVRDARIKHCATYVKTGFNYLSKEGV